MDSCEHIINIQEGISKQIDNLGNSLKNLNIIFPLDEDLIPKNIKQLPLENKNRLSSLPNVKSEVIRENKRVVNSKVSAPAILIPTSKGNSDVKSARFLNSRKLKVLERPPSIDIDSKKEEIEFRTTRTLGKNSKYSSNTSDKATDKFKNKLISNYSSDQLADLKRRMQPGRIASKQPNLDSLNSGHDLSNKANSVRDDNKIKGANILENLSVDARSECVVEFSNFNTPRGFAKPSLFNKLVLHDVDCHDSYFDSHAEEVDDDFDDHDVNCRNDEAVRRASEIMVMI